MRNRDSTAVTFFGFDTANNDHYQFDTWERARSWVDEEPETRWAVMRTVVERYEEYRMPRCSQCRTFTPTWAVLANGWCVKCNNK